MYLQYAFFYAQGDLEQARALGKCQVRRKKSNFRQLVVSMTNAVIGKETKLTVQVIHSFR